METIEEITPLEAYHQLVLFKLMDIRIYSWATYVAVDANSKIAFYESEPYWRTETNEWHRSSDGDCNSYAYMSGGIISVNIPHNVNWKDCVWKL